MHKRATKQETELRVAHAAELVAEGQAYSSITSLVAAKYGISRRRAKQITSNAYFLLKDDIEEGDLNRPEMTAKLVCTLENAMFRAMQEKQYSAVASNAKVLMKLIGLEAKIKSQRECFGSTRSQVRILSPRPFKNQVILASLPTRFFISQKSQ